MTRPRLFPCTDLDRNGPQSESPRAGSPFSGLVDRPEATLAYVSGRHLELLDRTIANYGLPPPDFALTNFQPESTNRIEC